MRRLIFASLALSLPLPALLRSDPWSLVLQLRPEQIVAKHWDSRKKFSISAQLERKRNLVDEELAASEDFLRTINLSHIIIQFPIDRGARDIDIARCFVTLPTADLSVQLRQKIRFRPFEKKSKTFRENYILEVRERHISLPETQIRVKHSKNPMQTLAIQAPKE